MEHTLVSVNGSPEKWDLSFFLKEIFWQDVLTTNGSQFGFVDTTKTYGFKRGNWSLLYESIFSTDKRAKYYPTDFIRGYSARKRRTVSALPQKS